MALNSTRIRLTRTSSDLRKLSVALLPPSPILKANDMLISLTSGEIPILLEVTTPRACDSPLLNSGEPLESRDIADELGLIDKLDNTVGNMRDLLCSDEALLEKSDNMHIAPEFSNERHEAEHPNNNLAKTIFGEMKHAIHPADDDGLGRDDGRGDGSTPIFVKRGMFKGFRNLQLASYPSTMGFGTIAVVPKEDLDGDSLLANATFHSYSTLPTPTFAPPSPSSSVDVISPSTPPVGRHRHRRPLERARAVRFPGRPRSPRLQVIDAESSIMHNAPPSPTKHISCSRWRLADSVDACRRMADTRVFDSTSPFMKHVALPKELSWIKHMTINLWIDQEGFRAVRSYMQLMGYSSRTRSLHPYESGEDVGSGVAAGVAEFMPTKRETFIFHYATLDSPPTLRMVSVAGDESRDYISRQATLSVKANGVYTVHGTETSIASILDGDSHGLRLHWKFDYLVSDRKVDGAGKALPGEKTLTPLTFSCSPYLFHPLQGKKTGLMHIMKKNLVPKLGSQKLEPPTHVLCHDILPQASRHLSIGIDAATHARSRSDAMTVKGGHYSLTRMSLDTGGGAILGMNHVSPNHRRRASSAGEKSLTCLGSEPGHDGIVMSKGGMFTRSPKVTSTRPDGFLRSTLGLLSTHSCSEHIQGIP